MAKLLKLRRGSTTAHASFTGAEGEVTIDTTKDTAVVHDGAQAGGRPLAREDMSNVSSASIAGQLGTDSIATTKIAAGALPTDVTVASANIVDGTIVNADVNASAAIAGTKIAPDFGSQNITTTGTIGSSGDITITNDIPRINFVDSGDNPDWEIGNINGAFRFRDTTNSATWMQINTDGHVDINGNLDVGAGVDVTGDITATGNVSATGDMSVSGGDLRIYGTQPGLHLTDTDNNDDFLIYNNNGTFKIYDSSDGVDRFKINSAGTCVATGNLDVGAGLDVTGEITSTGTNSINTSVDQKIILEGSSSPYIRWREGTTDKAYIQWHTAGFFDLVNQETGEYMRIGNGSSGLRFNHDGTDSTVWHSGNDGSGSGLDADTLDGVQGSNYAQKTGATCTGDFTFSGGSGAVTIAGASDIRLNDGTWTGNNTQAKIQGHSASLYLVYPDAGSCHIRDSAGNNNFTVDSSGNCTAIGNVTAYSDARLKTDVNTINDALGIVGKLRGVSYKWIATDKPSIGVIAQEVEEVIPEVVLTNVNTDPETGETTEVKSVDYGKIVGVLINAINELKAEVDELKGGK
jgi:hypothetical protein